MRQRNIIPFKSSRVILSVGKIGSVIVDMIAVNTVASYGSVFMSFLIAFAVNFMTFPVVVVANKLD